MCRLFCCRLAVMFLAACFLTPPWHANAQEQRAYPTKDDLAKFGELPVRFNGRVTTYDVVAKNYLRRFSGGEVCYDKDGKEHPAAHWLLDVMAGSQDHEQWRIFKITHPKLLERLKLKPYEGANAARGVFSIADIRSQSEAFAGLQKELGDKPTSQFDESERSFEGLYRRLASYLDLEGSFRPPAAIDGDNAQEAVATLQRLEHTPVPSFLPTPDGTDWTIYYRAYLLDAVAEEVGKDPRFQHFANILKAHRANEAEAFRKAVESYSQSLKGIPALNGPLELTPSTQWLESGVEPARELFFYSDANAPGLPIVDLHLAAAPDSRFLISYFQGQSFSEADLVNSWRIQLGLAPLPEEELKKTWKPTEIASRKALLIDHETPEDVDLPEPARYITTILKADDQTIVFAWFGEKAVIARNQEAHQDLMQSIQIKSVEELARWFGGKAEAEPFLPERFLAAVVPDGKQVWVLATSGTGPIVLSHRETFLEFLKTLKLKTTERQQTQLEWQLSEGWEKIGDYGEATLLMGQDENALPLTITPLGDVRDDTIATLVDYWAKKLGLAQLSDKDRKAAVTEITVSGRKAFLVELQKPKEAASAEITYQAPKGWKELPPGPLMQAAFEISQGGSAAKLTIVALPTNQNLAANINRWRAQLELPMQAEEEILKNVKDQTVDKQQGKLVELHNPDTKQRILAAIVTSGGKDWFFKMMGDAAVVEQEQKAFEAFLKTVKFAGPDQTKTEGQKP